MVSGDVDCRHISMIMRSMDEKSPANEELKQTDPLDPRLEELENLRETLAEQMPKEPEE
jgi:hypothetical protein